jgi:hypothetical protein
MKHLLIIFFLALSVGSLAQNPIVGRSIRLTGEFTASSLSTDQDDYALDPGYRIYYISASTPVTVSGIIAMGAGAEITIQNTSSNAITFTHEDTGSSAGNRINISGTGQVILGQLGIMNIRYNASTSRWIVLSTTVSVIESVGEPVGQASDLTVTNITTTTATATWTRGDGAFSILLIRQGQISDLPQDNVEYTGDLNYGDGDEIGTGLYVLTTTTGTTADITGLSASNQYDMYVMEYNQSGGSINYNTTITVGSVEPFATNASASTPTVPYTVTSVLTKEDSIIVFGTGGNGDNRAVLMALNKEVDAFFVDDVSYTADDFPDGDQVGTSNFVTANTTDETIRMAGFERDQEYSNPYIAEHTSLKYLLPPANGPPEFPELLRTPFVFEELFATGGTFAGETFLTASARLFYDFTGLTGTDGTGISNGNAGLEDLSPNANTATIIGTPTVEDLVVGAATVKALGDLSDEGVSTNSDGVGLIDSPFETFFTADFSDGIPASNTLLYGVLNTSADLIQVVLDATGDLEFYYNSSGASTLRFDSTDPVFADGATGLKLIRYRYDYAANSVSLWVNENPIPLTKISATSVSDHNPTSWTSALDFYVATLNNAGTPSSNPAINYVTSFAVTGLLTTQQADDVSEYLRLTATSDFENFIVHETAGFNFSVSNDSLILSGNPAGFEDYIYHIDFFPDSLGEFRIQAVVTIDDELQNGDVGLGLGAINDLDTEANRGVLGLFVTNPASANYGRVQLYSGTGAVSPTAFTSKDQSGGAFIPEKDSSYLFTFDRDIQGNDVMYSFSVMDLWDSVTFTTGWTELNRVSDEFYGETMKAIIYMNGGPFRINPFVIRRTGLEFGGDPDPPAPPFDADVFVQTNGDDANDCTDTEPCKTINRGFQRIGELSPTVTDMFIGAGNYPETSFLSVPTNAGEIRGAGRNLTFVTGAASLYTSTTVTSPSRSSDSRALVAMTSGSSTNVTTTFRAMTFLGNKDVGGTTNSIRHCFVINKRHGVILDDIAIKFFNTTALKLGEVDEFTMENFYIRSCSGESTSFTYYQIQTWNIGGAVEPDGTNFKIIFRDGLIEAQESTQLGDSWSEGGGWGMTGGPVFPQAGYNDKYQTNVEWDNVQFLINKRGIAQFSGHRFNMEGLYNNVGNISIHDCNFNNNISFGGLSDLAHTLGGTEIYNNTFTMNPDPPTFVIEMQISDVEIHHNFIRGAKNGGFTSLNDQDTFGNANHAPITRGDHGDWHIHHNIFELGTANGYGITGGLTWDIKGLIFEQNTIRFTTTSGGIWYLVVVDNDSDSQLTGLVIQNNAFINQPASSTIWDTGNISGGIMRNNKSTHWAVTASRAGVTSTNNQIHGAGNSLGLTLGTPPTTWDQAFNGDYYKPAAGSVLINAGFGSLTIGALEED